MEIQFGGFHVSAQSGEDLHTTNGNHDDEDGDSRRDQVKYMQGLPYSLVQEGQKDIHGAGNYVLKVYSADP